MAIVYIKLYHPAADAPSFSKNLLDTPCEVEYLKSAAPDDGEAIDNQGRYAIACPDGEWREVLERLKQSGESLVYSVIKKGEDEEAGLVEAGELNSDVQHYTTRSNNRGQIFAYWFEDCLPGRSIRLAA